MTRAMMSSSSQHLLKSPAICARLFILVIGVSALFLTGCESSAENQANEAVGLYFAGDYTQAQQLLDPIAKQTNSNFVLNNDRLGSTALAGQKYDDAEVAFLRSYEVLNSVDVNNGGRSLGAALIDEKIKIWKGEPFERAMVNFYLGMIYYKNHDYGNARAAFENALFKLRDYGPGDVKDDKYAEVESDFTLAYIMLGKSWQRLGEPEKAQAQFDRVAKLRPDLATLANADYNNAANVVLVVDWGDGPTIRTDFDGSIVGFAPTPQSGGPIFMPQVIVDGKYIDTNSIARPSVDMLALAQDRRWQSIDTIRAVKSAVGTGLLAAGAVEASRGRRSDEEIGAGLLAAGLLLKATSQADVRQWEMLPRTTFIIPVQLTPGTHDVDISFPNGARIGWRGLVAPDKDDNTYYLRVLGGYPIRYR
jgi:tetratricopeptide (TPR) repeat protein